MEMLVNSLITVLTKPRLQVWRGHTFPGRSLCLRCGRLSRRRRAFERRPRIARNAFPAAAALAVLAASFKCFRSEVYLNIHHRLNHKQKGLR